MPTHTRWKRLGAGFALVSAALVLGIFFAASGWADADRDPMVLDHCRSNCSLDEVPLASCTEYCQCVLTEFKGGISHREYVKLVDALTNSAAAENTARDDGRAKYRSARDHCKASHAGKIVE